MPPGRSQAAVAAQGGVDDALRKALQNGFPTVQKILDEAISVVASGTYSTLYFLPGNGTRTSGSSIRTPTMTSPSPCSRMRANHDDRRSAP